MIEKFERIPALWVLFLLLAAGMAYCVYANVQGITTPTFDQLLEYTNTKKGGLLSLFIAPLIADLIFAIMIHQSVATLIRGYSLGMVIGFFVMLCVASDILKSANELMIMSFFTIVGIMLESEICYPSFSLKALSKGKGKNSKEGEELKAS